MPQLHFEAQEFNQSKVFLSKVLEVETKNKWAMRLMGEAGKKSAGV